MRHFTNKAATGASDEFRPNDAVMGHRDAYLLIQVDISDTATVQIQGRVASDLEWTSLTEEDITFPGGVFQVVACPEMRLEVTSYTSGYVNAASKI